MAASPALAQEVNIDYAHHFDFWTVKTFQDIESDETKAGSEERGYRAPGAQFSPRGARRAAARRDGASRPGSRG